MFLVLLLTMGLQSFIKVEQADGSVDDGQDNEGEGHTGEEDQEFPDI